jgi:hypothetical protein
MLLCESPYEKELVCQITDVWFPRTLPLKGEYDSYGSVCNVQEGLQRDVWLEALQYDLHEVGGTRGAPTSKAMSFQDLLDAARESRLMVMRKSPLSEYGFFFDRKEEGVNKLFIAAGMPELCSPPRKWREPTPSPDWLPTISSLQEIITAAGENIFNNFHAPGYTLANERHGSIIISWMGCGDTTTNSITKLEQIQQLLAGRFSTMITCSSNYRSNSAELMVRPLPADGEHRDIGVQKEDRPLNLQIAMIREDVWAALVAVGKTLTFQKPFDQQGPSNQVIGQVSLGTHWEFIQEKIKEAGIDEAGKLEEVCSDFWYVSLVLNATRYLWRPSYAVGPQFGSNITHSKVLHSLLKIVDGDITQAKEMGELYDEFNDVENGEEEDDE